MEPPVTAVYDANILYPAPLRDLFLRLAQTGLVRARWTETIHDEWLRSLLRANPRLSPERLNRTRVLMNEAVRDCLVTGYEELIDSLTLPDPDDRHVLGANCRLRHDDSPARSKTSRTVSAETRNPTARNRSKNGATLVMSPRVFASKSNPSVPRTGTPSIAAARRAGPSSINASEPGVSRASANTSVSPAPSRATLCTARKSVGVWTAIHSQLAGSGKSSPLRRPTANS